LPFNILPSSWAQPRPARLPPPAVAVKKAAVDR
jgi:hypothetical protein